MIDSNSCEARNVIIHRENEEKFGHYTFYKEGDNWYYHPPGHPETQVFCNNQELDAIKALVEEAEKKYAEKKGICQGGIPPTPTIPPPSSSPNPQKMKDASG